jgi:hypothetical protein
MKLEFSQQISEKYSNIKFHENLSSGSRVVPCGWTDGQTDIYMTKLIIAFRNFIYVLTVIGLTPGGSTAVHIYTLTIHRITK